MKEESKFIVYKSSGGLFHNLRGLFFSINFALLNNYVLIIDMKTHDAFKNNFTTFFNLYVENLEWYDNYNIIPKELKYNNLTIEEIKNTQPRIRFGRKYFIEDREVSLKPIKKCVNGERITIFCGTGTDEITYYDNLKINQKIYDKLMLEKHFECDYISVHFRNSDIKNDYNKFINTTKECIKKTNIRTVFLASDCRDMPILMKKYIRNARIIRYIFPPKNILNLHYGSDNKYKQVYESIRDIYFILKSKYFIPSRNSGYSRQIIKMIKDKKYIIPNMKCNTKIYSVK